MFDSTPRQLSFSQLLMTFMATRGGWIVLSCLWACALRLTISEFNRLDPLLFVSVILAWPALEWGFHRYLLHEWTLLPFHRTHDRHHRNPTPDTGLPDTWIVIGYFVLASIMWAGGLRYLLTASVAVLAMLAIYEFVHFSCHCSYRPLTSWGWAIRINHLQHHKLDETKQYSMLFPLSPTGIKRRS